MPARVEVGGLPVSLLAGSSWMGWRGMLAEGQVAMPTSSSSLTLQLRTLKRARYGAFAALNNKRMSLKIQCLMRDKLMME